MQRIRAVQLVAGLAIGDQSGGAEYFGIQLARHLDKNQFESVIFGMWQYASPTEKKWLATLESENLQVWGLTRATRFPIFDLRDIFSRLWSLANTFRPHVINSHSQRGDLLCILLHLLHPSHPHAIRTVHIDQPWLNRSYMDLCCNQTFFPLAFNAEAAISEVVKQKLDRRPVARLLNKKSVLCYNGIDANLFHQERATRRDLPSNVPNFRPRIGVIGKLTQRKGHSDLLQAMSIVCQTQPVHLLVIGSGPLETDLRQQASNSGLQDFVHFLGSRNDVLELLPHLDMVVSSSLWEGLPTVLLEAMALGVPVVASDISGNREIVKTDVTGLLVPPGEPPRLAKAILTMLNDPSRARVMAENAKRLVQQFTIQNAAARYAQIYRQAANAGT